MPTGDVFRGRGVGVPHCRDRIGAGGEGSDKRSGVYVAGAGRVDGNDLDGRNVADLGTKCAAADVRAATAIAHDDECARR